MSAEIKKFMGRALLLARRATGQTFPNPLVGAVVVKSGVVVGEGYHRRAGGPHAEIMALRRAGARARGAALYCTLEPCAHHGRTGPCAEAIIRAGIRRVYVAMIDPNPVNAGRGLARLREAGIGVQTGFLQQEAEALNEPFVHAMRLERPLVTVKIAQSLDGKVATRRGRSQWITEAYSRARSHEQRSSFDAIMVGIDTVLADDPRLEPALTARDHVLTKIIVDSRMRLPLKARLLATRQPVIVAALKRDARKERALNQRGAQVIYTRADRGRVDLKDLLRRLHHEEIRNLLVEGGPTLIGSFFDKRLADKISVYLSPCIIGGKDALSSVLGHGVGLPSKAARVVDASCRRLKGDWLIEGRLRYCSGRG
jgi:diaminohydroxyphosphoribosylaminopyrimidine deaminase/5-amino-6-(5-phosphoribosylamino)uracil reductase